MNFIETPRLPIIDLSPFDSGDPWRDHVAAQIDWASSTFGVFYIVGHGIDTALVDTLMELGGRFVARQESVKRRAGGGRVFPNLPGFRDAAQEYITAMTGLGHKLMTLMARGLRLEDSYFVDRYTGAPATRLRILDYPIALRSEGATGEAPDVADGRLLTLAKQGQAGALQVRFGERWIDVPDVPEALVCYVGPVLARVTRGRYLQAQPRVSGGCGERLSLSFYFDPARDAVPLPIAPEDAHPGTAAADDRSADALHVRQSSRAMVRDGLYGGP